MKILNHRLWLDDCTPAQQHTIPACNYGPTIIQQRLIVIHYTAGKNPLGTISWFLDPKSQVSSHFLIDRNGKISQFVPLNRMAWHAGQSEWKGLTWLNQWSIGIELDNIGFTRIGFSLPSELQVVATHKDEPKPRTWEKYPDLQIDSAIELCRLLVATYPTITEVVGHDDVSPNRKKDPGPAFPIMQFQHAIFDTAPPTPKLPTRDECVDKILEEHGFVWKK